MDNLKSNINNNVNKDSGNSSNKEVVLQLSKELIEANIVSEIKYIVEQKLLRITFSNIYDNETLSIQGDVKNWYAWTDRIESSIKRRMPKLSNNHRLMIEATINNNIDLLLDAIDNHSKTIQKKNQGEEGEGQQAKKIHLRKYVLDGQLYESVIVDKSPKFLSVSITENYDNQESNTDTRSGEKPDKNDIQFKLVDRIDIPNYEFYPADSLVTHNPLPYSFESEDELKKYTELAKKETFDSIFQKILEQIRNFVNIEEHVQVILAADTLYSYFQEKFGATHYNIFIGENGSGKNSALLFFKMLGYRVFYVTAASAANYYTFLGEIQEGQGTIAEDEADDIGYDRDKQRILKTGYASGGNVPKVEFSKNGSTRSQASYLTFCHKWLAMEELPDEKRIRGMLDRSFIFNFIMGDVKYNIKKVIKDENSSQHKDLVHLRKLLFAFKVLQQGTVFQDIKINIKNRNAELIEPLLRIFYNTSSFEKIQKALSSLINEKTYLKSNSLESKIAETLDKIIMGQGKDDDDKIDKEIIEVTNEKFYPAFLEVADAEHCIYDDTNLTFYLPDGTKMSKKKINRILSSKFKAKPIRTKEKRGFQINKKDIEKISKQYEVIEEIKVLEDISIDKDIKLEHRHETVTQVTDVTDVTHFKGAIPYSSQNANTDAQCNEVYDACSSNKNNKEDSLIEAGDKDNEGTDTSFVLNPAENNDKDVLDKPTFEDKINRDKDDQSTNETAVLNDSFNEYVKEDNVIL